MWTISCADITDNLRFNFEDKAKTRIWARWSFVWFCFCFGNVSNKSLFIPAKADLWRRNCFSGYNVCVYTKCVIFYDNNITNWTNFGRYRNGFRKCRHLNAWNEWISLYHNLRDKVNGKCSQQFSADHENLNIRYNRNSTGERQIFKTFHTFWRLVITECFHIQLFQLCIVDCIDSSIQFFVQYRLWIYDNGTNLAFDNNKKYILRWNAAARDTGVL